MQRRRFITGTAAAVAAPTFAGLGTPRLARARPADAAAFDAAAQGQPLLAGFKGVRDDATFDAPAPLLRGRWPAALRGHFYRNGPALHERGGQRYHHWFDGDGMVQQFTIADGRVMHRGRLVRTAKLEADRRAGRFTTQAFGTFVDDAAPVSGPDAVNPANTSIVQHGGRLLALWEGGSAHELDPRDLSTIGPVTWRADLAQLPFSAHPKVDTAGHLWNIGTFGDRIVVWHLDAAGALAGVQAGRLPLAGTMVHDMAVTARWLVVPLPPVKIGFGTPSDGPRRFALEPGEPLRVLVMDKADIARRRVFELPPQMVFHVGNAHEARDGRIVLSLVTAPDTAFLDQAAVRLMAGHLEPMRSRAELRLLTLDMTSGRTRLETPAPGAVEFPRVHPQRVGREARYVATGAGWHAATPLLHAVQVVDLRTGRVQRHDYGSQAIAEEHVLVPKPGGRGGERDAWLLGTTLDARRGATVLNLLDAARIDDGPIAQAVLPYVLPLGLHGHFEAG
jgi:carotenoid cleavage dioxygenase